MWLLSSVIIKSSNWKPPSPHYALPIHNNENPHFSKTKHRFVRPIRQSKYPKSNFFKYDSSKAFYKNKKEVLRQIQFNNLPWNKLHANVLLLISIYFTSAILWPQDHETIIFYNCVSDTNSTILQFFYYIVWQ